MSVAFEAFDDHQIGRAQLRQKHLERRLRLVAQLVNDGPSPARCHHDLGSAGFAMLPGVLAGPVDIERVVRVFDG